MQGSTDSVYNNLQQSYFSVYELFSLGYFTSVRLDITSIDSLQSRAEVLVEVVFGIYDLSKDETFNK